MSQEAQALKVLQTATKPLSRIELATLTLGRTRLNDLNSISAFISSLRKKGYALRKTRKGCRVFYKYLGETKATKRTINTPTVTISDELVNKCLHLIKAKQPHVVSINDISEFFDITPEHSLTLLNKVNKVHPNDVNLAIQAAA